MIDRRRHDRFAVTLPCRVEFAAASLAGTVVELSEGGARVAFPLTGNTADLFAVSSILIDGIGRLEAEVIWQSGNTLGLAFRSDARRAKDYLDRLQAPPVRAVPPAG